MPSLRFRKERRSLHERGSPVPKREGGATASRGEPVFLSGPRAVMFAVLGLVQVGAIGLFDYQTGTQVSFAILYLIPIGWGAWLGGFSTGILLSLASAITWHQVDMAKEPTILRVILLWNGITRFGIFVIASSLLSRLHLSIQREKLFASTDSLTGAVNGRTFYAAVCSAVDRSLRMLRPLTLAYFDLDNFKWLNDNLGHSAGDEALCEVVRVIRQNIRGSDVLARLGGDEFALLLPDAPGEAARTVLNRLQTLFGQVMARKGWPVRLSIGAATFLRPSADVDVMVRHVDELMYAAKKAGKDRVVHQVVDEVGSAAAGEGLKLERRVTARVLCNRLARVRAEGTHDHAEEFARVQDISASGLCLRADRQLPAQALLTIEPLHVCSAKTLLARVVWSAQDGGGWKHECVLSNRLSADELAPWVVEQATEALRESVTMNNGQAAG